MGNALRRPGTFVRAWCILPQLHIQLGVCLESRVDFIEAPKEYICEKVYRKCRHNLTISCRLSNASVEIVCSHRLCTAKMKTHYNLQCFKLMTAYKKMLSKCHFRRSSLSQTQGGNAEQNSLRLFLWIYSFLHRLRSTFSSK